MPIRYFTLLVILLTSLVLPAQATEEIGPFTGPEAAAEAMRLYTRANDFVNNLDEGKYSYAYIQFHWKRAGANLERILRAYPSSPTAKKIQADELMVGEFSHIYFKERVLPRIEEKKVGAFDAINNAIFLYYLPSNTDFTGRRELLRQIIITLCRQERWDEVITFPVPPEDGTPWLWQLITRMAVYKKAKIADELLLNSKISDLPALLAIVAESRAFRGDTREQLEIFLQENASSPELRAAIFAGLVRREIQIQRARELKRPLAGLYDGVDAIQKPEQTIDLAAFLQTITVGPWQPEAHRNYARYLAALGRLTEARSLVEPAEQLMLVTAYAEYLVATEEYGQALALPTVFKLTPSDATAYRLHLIKLLAQAGRETELAHTRTQLPANLAAQAVYQEWHGRILSIQNQLVVREHTFALIPLADPNLLGRLICEWSLTPNRNLRGAAPWDAVVYKFASGYAQLPPPKDKNKMEAAGR